MYSKTCSYFRCAHTFLSSFWMRGSAKRENRLLASVSSVATSSVVTPSRFPKST